MSTTLSAAKLANEHVAKTLGVAEEYIYESERAYSHQAPVCSWCGIIVQCQNFGFNELDAMMEIINMPEPTRQQFANGLKGISPDVGLYYR
ncbi:MAG: hypothetical protein ACI8WB_005618, partial [Phenylobacterium sp.]